MVQFNICTEWPTLAFSPIAMSPTKENTKESLSARNQTVQLGGMLDRAEPTTDRLSSFYQVP